MGIAIEKRSFPMYDTPTGYIIGADLLGKPHMGECIFPEGTTNKSKEALKAQIEQEIKPIVKQLFDYQIPIAQIEKAGITTTGAECENELNALLEEYTPYRTENKLWLSDTLHYAYKVENNEMYRQVNGGTWVKVK